MSGTVLKKTLRRGSCPGGGHKLELVFQRCTWRFDGVDTPGAPTAARGTTYAVTQSPLVPGYVLFYLPPE